MLPVPTEHDEQATLVKWADLASKTTPELRLLFAVPNGGERHKLVAAKLKAEGVRSGVPDLLLPVARYPHHGLFIEMKRRKGSTTSANQLHWIGQLRGSGYRVEVCKGWQDATEVLIDYLKQPPFIDSNTREAYRNASSTRTGSGCE